MPFEKVGVRATIEGVGAYVRDANRIERSTGGMSRSVQGVGSRFSVSTTQALRFGAALVGVQLGISVMSRTIIGLQESTIGAAIAFESSFAGIRKTVNLTEGGFAQLARANRDLAKDIPVSVNELNRIGELAGQLGIRGVENIVAFEDAIAKIAVTTDLTSDSAALSFAQIANVMKLPQDQIENMASAVVGLGNNFATVESQIVRFAQRIAGAGAVVGLTTANIFGIATAFASVGVPAEAGGTAVQKVLLEMQKAASQGGESLDVFAAITRQTVDEFRAAFAEDAAGVLVEFVEGLGDLGDDATRVLAALGLEDQRLRAAFLSAAQGGDVLARAISTGTAEFDKNTALSAEAARRFDTMESKLTLLRNAFADIGITAGDTLLAGMEPVIEATQEWIDQNGDQFARDFAEGLQDAAGAGISLAGALGDVLQALRDLDREAKEAGVGGGGGLAGTLAAFIAARFGPKIAGALSGIPLGALPGINTAVLSAFIPGGVPEIGDRTAAERQIAELGLDFEQVSRLLAEGAIETFTDEFQRARFRFAEGGEGLFQRLFAIPAARERLGITGPPSADDLEAFNREFERLLERSAREPLGPEAPGRPGREPPDISGIETDAERKAREARERAAKAAFARLQQQAKAARERIQRDQIAGLDAFGALLVDALRRRAQAELDVELKEIDDARDARRRALDERLRDIETERDAAVAAIEDERDARLATLDDELASLREESDADELARLERERALAFEEKDAADADARIREFKRGQRRREIQDEKTDVRSRARGRIEAARNEAERLTEIAKQSFEEDSRLLDDREEKARSTFEQTTADWLLESRARRLIMEEENEEIARLLAEQGETWRTSGKSFGEQLVEGIRGELDPFLASIFADVPGTSAFSEAAANRRQEVAGRQEAGKQAKAAGAPDSVLEFMRRQLIDLFGVVPDFPHGGLVGGRGERVPIFVEPGEIVLNRAQQAAVLAPRTIFERGAFEGMLSGASFSGDPRSNARAIRAEFDDLIDDQLGRGAFIAGAGG